MIKVTGGSKPSPNAIPIPERQTEWTAPTGRKLVPGTEMKVEGQPGKWIFVAYVDHPNAPYVEAKKAAKGRGNIRCFHPDRIHTVSNKKGGSE